MDNESYQVKLESGEELEFPKNIFFIYLLNISPNNNFLFNPEISRVFGLVYSLYPEPITYLKYMEKFPDHDLIEKKKILYMFKKTNSFIAKRFGKEYQLGHWSSLMNLDFEGNWIEHFREIFIFHISSIKGNAEDRQQRKQLLNKAMLNFEESFNKKGFGLIITKSGEKQENYLLSIFKTVDAFFWMLGIILSSLVALIGRQILSKKRKITHSLMDEGDLIIKRWQENKITDEMATKMLKSLSAKVFRKGRNNQLNADAANMLQMQIKAHMDTLEISRKIQPQIEDKDLSSEIKKLISQSLNDNILEDHEIENLMDALKEKYSLNSEAQNQIKNLLKTKK